MRLQHLRPPRRFGPLQRAEIVQVRHLRVHDNLAVQRQPHDQVGLAFFALGLFHEIAMGAHAGRLHDPSQRFLTPAASRLVRFEHRPELRRLRRQ